MKEAWVRQREMETIVRKQFYVTGQVLCPECDKVQYRLIEKLHCYVCPECRHILVYKEAKGD